MIRKSFVLKNQSCHILAKEDFYNCSCGLKPLYSSGLSYPRKRGLLQLLREFRSSLVLSCYILAKEDFYNNWSASSNATDVCCYILAKEDFYNIIVTDDVRTVECCYILAKEDFYNTSEFSSFDK